MNRTIRKVAFLWIGLCISALTGCVSWFYTPGMGELKRLCRLDGGDKIYKVVHTDGYFDVNGRCTKACLYSLIHSDYQYIEYEEVELSVHSAMQEPGYWRIYKSDPDDPNCNARLGNMFSESQRKTVLDFFASSCLAARKLEKPESRYWYRHGTTSRFLDKDEEVLFHTLQESIEDSANQQVLAEGKFYSLVPYRKSALDYALTFDCKDAGIDIKTFRFPESVLLPLRKQGDKK